ncbi:HAD family phosphatase [Actinoallomurus spadix]|uniref:Hydrolase n=1 Tax=Actinoallomurus spadix TaxID=79912 RepID=A0ABN0WI31_9ACTN|nr:HAD family phosphatase [Actinoallomurus spadix]MCO5990903.1 HAD family phosphatase [Actinoallomurus spadix]
MTVRGLITDWGGVLTTPLKETITAWIEADDIDPDAYKLVMREWVDQAYAGDGAVNPIHGLEDGSLSPAEFERLLAERLRTRTGTPVPADGLLTRMFLAFEPVEPMYDALRRVKSAGVRTCLLSNSWGNTYPRELFAEMFDAVVISSEVRLRKPDPAIFHHALELIGLSPEECAFIDDIEHNVRAAEELGITGVHYVDATSTVARLEGLLGISLS